MSKCLRTGFQPSPFIQMGGELSSWPRPLTASCALSKALSALVLSSWSPKSGAMLSRGWVLAGWCRSMSCCHSPVADSPMKVCKEQASNLVDALRCDVCAELCAQFCCALYMQCAATCPRDLQGTMPPQYCLPSAACVIVYCWMHGRPGQHNRASKSRPCFTLRSIFTWPCQHHAPAQQPNPRCQPVQDGIVQAWWLAALLALLLFAAQLGVFE